MSWRRNKYHLNALLLVLPLLYLGHYAAMYSGADAADAVHLPARPVGPWRVAAVTAPYAALSSSSVWDVHAAFSGPGRAGIRAAFAAIDDSAPGIERLWEVGYSAALHGGSDHLEAHVPVPAKLGDDAALWITVEAWDGRVYRTSWPLRP